MNIKDDFDFFLMSYKFSIITINYNNLTGLKKTIESVVSQTYKNIQYIVIDGDSTDGSKEFINENSASIDYWVSEPDNGIYHAMNKGIQVAKGDFLLFLNSGDYLYNNSLFLAWLNIHENRTKDIFIFNSIVQEDNQLIFGKNQKFGILFLMERMINHQNIIYSYNCFRKSMYNLDYRICADYEHLLKLILDDFEYVQINEYLSVFDSTGISSREIERLNIERNLILRSLISNNFRQLIDESIENNRTLERLKKSRIIKFLQFLGFYKFVQQ